MGLASGGLSDSGLKAVSFSRDSAPRLREWEERHRPTRHDAEHKRNRWTAARHGLTVAAEISAVECAAEVGQRGEEIIRAARDAGATVVIVPSLRRLGVGVAQVQLRKRLEDAGLTIVSEVDRERAVLACEPSPRRDRDLGQFALDDEYEWARNKQRLADAHLTVRGTEAWERTLDFVQASGLRGDRLCRALELHGHRTVAGAKRWHRQQAIRARQEAAARNGRHVTPQILREAR